MIKVTDEMIGLIKEYNELINKSPDELAKQIIELHEQSKPKPEPVGYAYPSQYAEALENEGCFLVFVVPVTNLDTGEESSLPLYTAPPTREPLSQSDLGIFIGEFLMIEKPLKNLSHFARIIEQAHGIGVKA